MRRAFTLIELMIVVAIIGILASIAIPNFVKFQCRAKQTEAKTGLKNIMVAEELYHGEHDTYIAGTEANELIVTGFAIAGTVRRYDFVVTAATSTTYSATATAGTGIGVNGTDLVDANGNPDQWFLSQEGGFTPILDVCR